MSLFRLSFFHLEFLLRHLGGWPILAENRWPHTGRELTPHRANVWRV
jgi:hypothetical protein